MDETTILVAIRETLAADMQTDGQLYADGVRWIHISEGGDIDAGVPTPCIAIDASDVNYVPRTMTSDDRRVTLNVVIHVYLDLTDREGPETGALQIKRICRRVETLLQRNKLNLNILLPPTTGTITYPPYGQRNYTDRREGRIPVTYRWIDTLEA